MTDVHHGPIVAADGDRAQCPPEPLENLAAARRAHQHRPALLQPAQLLRQQRQRAVTEHDPDLAGAIGELERQAVLATAAMRSRVKASSSSFTV
jgi:hypothetical protein